MQNKFQQSIYAGIAATIIMTLFMMLGHLMGMPKMSPPEMLAAMMKMPLTLGWVSHFIIGVIFAGGYVFLFNKLLRKIKSNALRGAVYGLIAFIIAQLSFPVLAAIFGEMEMPDLEGSMVLMMTGSVLGHVLFGMVIGLLIKKRA